MRIFILSFVIALDGVFTHKLRSFLTMLGIIFGVTAVVTMLGIGEGAQKKILATISVLGIKNIYAYDQRDVRKDLLKGEGKWVSPGLSMADVEALRGILGASLTATAPVRESTEAVLFRTVNVQSKVVATTEAYFRALSLPIREGRVLSPEDDKRGAPVAVLGGGLALRLQRAGFQVGEKVKIKDVWFTVVGILESKATSAKRDDNMNFEDFNDNVYVSILNPLGRRDLGGLDAELDRLILSVERQEQVGAAGVLLERTLARKHRGLRDYKIVIPEDLLRQHKETQRIFDVVLGSIAGISLLVGGIGIMNIMLASILERTKEIGLRRALGATRAHIQWQFLLEATLLSAIGGLVGLVLAFAAAFVVTGVWGMPTEITPLSCILAFGVAASTGIGFGFFPARKAGRMSPIEALRYE